MSAPVDVLAVLASERDWLMAHRFASAAKVMDDTRAAVAELIDAADEVARTDQGMFRLRRALARIGGAP